MSGIGQHTVGCFAEDNAVDPSGGHGTSTTASWSLKIGQPTELGIAFDKLVGLRCHRARVRVTIRGHWITVRRHGKRVKVEDPHAHQGRARRALPSADRPSADRRLRPRSPPRPPRQGQARSRYFRVVVPPHVVAKTARRVRFGHTTTVNGWLGTSTGTALGGPGRGRDRRPGQREQRVRPGRRGHHGRPTAPGRRHLPAGPSRIVEAVYNGSPTTESSSSGQVRVVVPAVVRIAIHPRIVPWGSEIRVTGQVLGGYVPTNSSLLRLNVGIGRIGQIEGLPDIRPNGRFLIVWKFVAGQRRDPPVVLGRDARGGGVPLRARNVKAHGRHPGQADASPRASP